jgi:hypothetical protein
MKFPLLNYVAVMASTMFLLTACDAPESVRFGNGAHKLSRDLCAAVPVDFMQYEIALGDTIAEVQNKLGFYLHLVDFENYQQAEFTVNSVDNFLKPKVECLFVKQRLVCFKADYEFIEHEENISDTLEKLAKQHPSILNFRNELVKNGISMYTSKNLGEQVTFTFKMDNIDNYKGCVYQIAYPEFSYKTNI